MRTRFNNKYFKTGLTVFLVFLACLFAFYLIFFGSQFKDSFNKIINILSPVVVGLITAYLLTPVLNFIQYRILVPLCNKMKIKESRKRSTILRGIAVTLTGLSFFAIIYGLVAMFISQVVPSVIGIVNNFDKYITNFSNWIDKTLTDNPETSDYIVNTINKYSDDLENWFNNNVMTQTTALLKTVSLTLIGFIKALWNFIIGFIISIYVLSSKERFAGQFKKMTYALYDTNVANVIINNFRFAHKTFIGFVGGKVLDSFIIGILCFIGTSIMKTPYYALVSVIVGVTNVIPFFGPYIGAIPSALLILIVDPTHPQNVLYFVIFILILQQVDGNIIGPKILGESTGLSGFWVIFAITLFGGLFGVPGMIFGVPLFAVIYAAIRAFMELKLTKRELPSESKQYENVAAIEGGIVHQFIPDHKLPRKERKKSVYGKNFLASFDADIFAQSDEDGNAYSFDIPLSEITGDTSVARSSTHVKSEAEQKSTEVIAEDSEEGRSDDAIYDGDDDRDLKDDSDSEE